MKKLLVALALAAFGPMPAHALGMATSFADVSVDKVPVGQKFLVTSAPGGGFMLWNPQDDDIDVDIQALSPNADQLRGGAAPIPDPSWVQIEPHQFHLLAKSQRKCKVTLNIPHDRQYTAKYYQVMIWSRGMPSQTAGLNFSAGLLSRLRFETSGG